MEGEGDDEEPDLDAVVDGTGSVEVTTGEVAGGVEVAVPTSTVIYVPCVATHQA